MTNASPSSDRKFYRGREEEVKNRARSNGCEPGFISETIREVLLLAQRLLNIGDEVFGILNSDRETNCLLTDARFLARLGGH